MTSRAETIAELEDIMTTNVAAGDYINAERVDAMLQRFLQANPTPPLELGRVAIWYAEQGLHVFPLIPNTKIPYKKSRGLGDATTDLNLIRAWWDAAPMSNIGIATGHLVDVIDIDGGPGVVSWARLTRLPPVIGQVATPRPGGHHLYIRATGNGNRAKMAPGIDYRGIGGYVLAPPSTTSEHTPTPTPYYWTRPLELTP